MLHGSLDTLEVRPRDSIPRNGSLEVGTEQRRSNVDCLNPSDTVADGWCGFGGRVGPSLGDQKPKASQLESWPKSVEDRWQRVLFPKSRNELALLSWNTNGGLELKDVGRIFLGVGQGRVLLTSHKSRKR